MNAHGFIAVTASFMMVLPCACAHGRSQEMIDMFNAPPPEWLTIGKPIVVEPNDAASDDSVAFRPLSGGAKNTLDRVKIPSRGIEIRVDYEISWYYGRSLSPDGTMLIVNSGMKSRLYEISKNGSHRELEVVLPGVTYDPGLKGFITGWSWAGNDVLLGRSTITDDGGHDIIEKRIYAFHMKDRILSRFDVSALGLPEGEIFDVSGVGSDLNHLKLSVNGKEFRVKANLATPPEPMKIGLAESAASHAAGGRPPPRAPATVPRESPTNEQSFSWKPWLAVILVTAITIMLGRLLWKRD